MREHNKDKIKYSHHGTNTPSRQSKGLSCRPLEFLKSACQQKRVVIRKATATREDTFVIWTSGASKVIDEWHSTSSMTWAMMYVRTDLFISDHLHDFSIIILFGSVKCKDFLLRPKGLLIATTDNRSASAEPVCSVHEEANTYERKTKDLDLSAANRKIEIKSKRAVRSPP